MSIDAISPQLTATLKFALPVMAQVFRDPWWIIGSAAMRLGGVANVEPADVDVLCSAGDAGRLIAAWQDHLDIAHGPHDGDRFRSRFARFRHLPVPLEVMGNLQVLAGGSWQPVRIEATQSVWCDGYVVPIGTWQEQILVLRLLGRDKDLAKADLISSHIETEHANVG
ncbi:hypothetical protein [Pseudoxanthomonas sp. UTMC 1351]|uniref:hypothetical protein n=1 Tax=Pseudoxanthomonas sp. UTMC 1351 TaxID=2695853 RepID=UPI0034CF1AF7